MTKVSDFISKKALVVVMAVFVALAMLFLVFVPIENLPDSALLDLTDIPWETVDENEAVTRISRDDALAILGGNSALGALFESCGFQELPANATLRLVRDNVRGYIRWESSSDVSSIWIDADSGEIVYYFCRLLDEEPGTTTLQDAVVMAETYIGTFFAPLPSDALFENASFRAVIKRHSLAENGTLVDESTYAYEVLFSRYRGGIPSDDKILVWVSTSGRLLLYVKDWKLKMPESTDPLVPEAKAISMALAVKNGTVLSSELRIVRPNHFWQYGKAMYGDSNGRLSWVINLETENSHLASVWIDAITGGDIGGWM